MSYLIYIKRSKSYFFIETNLYNNNIYFNAIISPFLSIICILSFQAMLFFMYPSMTSLVNPSSFS